MTEEEIRQRFGELGVWQRGDRRAPHKPLLLLYTLGRYQRGSPRHGRPVRLPREEVEHPRLEYVRWQREEVFQGPGMAVS